MERDVSHDDRAVFGHPCGESATWREELPDIILQRDRVAIVPMGRRGRVIRRRTTAVP
jgi:hypothetical protein